MCVAIPYGRPNRDGGTRLGRYLRRHRTHLTRLVALMSVAAAPTLTLGSGGSIWTWYAPLLVQGAISLAMAALLEWVPGYCGVSNDLRAATADA